MPLNHTVSAPEQGEDQATGHEEQQQDPDGGPESFATRDGLPAFPELAFDKGLVVEVLVGQIEA
jgi:hypothetical protein